MSYLLSILILIALVILFLKVLSIIWKFLNSGFKNQQAQLDKLVASGFHIDHKLDGGVVVVFNDTKREIAFVYADTVVRCSYNDIISHEWTWTERNAVRRDNSLNFTLNNIKHPLIKVNVLGFNKEKTAEFWHAKITAILRN